MRLLVCGGAGFIGSAFVRRMLEQHADWEIVCYDKLTYAGTSTTCCPSPRTRATASSRAASAIARPSSAPSRGAGGVDAIVNFAAETHVDRSIDDPESFLRTDIFGERSTGQNITDC